MYNNQAELCMKNADHRESTGNELAAAVCAGDVLWISSAVERQGDLVRENTGHHRFPGVENRGGCSMVAVLSVASTGCSRGVDLGLLSVDISGDNIWARIQPQNGAPQVKNWRYTELGSIGRAGSRDPFHSIAPLYTTPPKSSCSPVIVITILAIIVAIVLMCSHQQYQGVIVNSSIGSATSCEGLHAGEKAKHKLSGVLDATR
ncbi:hypothetical protein EDD85DRAFT_793988 [Armillaria nabsnona]|nr:hypothetical protein EDD85DRAFT_793988 [Armillaria nabsnona]